MSTVRVLTALIVLVAMPLPLVAIADTLPGHVQYDCTGTVSAQGQFTLKEFGQLANGQSTYEGTVTVRNDDARRDYTFSLIVARYQHSRRSRRRFSWLRRLRSHGLYKLCNAGLLVVENDRSGADSSSFDTKPSTCSGALIQAGEEFAIGGSAKGQDRYEECKFRLIEPRRRLVVR